MSHRHFSPNHDNAPCGTNLYDSHCPEGIATEEGQFTSGTELRFASLLSAFLGQRAAQREPQLRILEAAAL